MDVRRRPRSTRTAVLRLEVTLGEERGGVTGTEGWQDPGVAPREELARALWREGGGLCCRTGAFRCGVFVAPGLASGPRPCRLPSVTSLTRRRKPRREFLSVPHLCLLGFNEIFYSLRS